MDDQDSDAYAELKLDLQLLAADLHRPEPVIDEEAIVERVAAT